MHTGCGIKGAQCVALLKINIAKTNYYFQMFVMLFSGTGRRLVHGGGYCQDQLGKRRASRTTVHHTRRAGYTTLRSELHHISLHPVHPHTHIGQSMKPVPTPSTNPVYPSTHTKKKSTPHSFLSSPTRTWSFL